MKKFDRLAPELRRQEIREAALRLFNQKGFAATTMENIVSEVSLSKGGVYRLYPSTTAILADLMIEGMHLRNAYYESRVRSELAEGGELTLPFLVDMIGDSLLLYPDFSGVYVEFLWEKRRNPELEQLYEQICRTTVSETAVLIERYGAQPLLDGTDAMKLVTELMNAAVLILHVLDLRDFFTARKSAISAAILSLLASADTDRI